MILGDNELQLYANGFLCRLYLMTQGIIERRFNRYVVFRALGNHSISEDRVRQATDEIVQFLYLHCNFIRVNDDSEDIRLTMAGLAEAQRICAETPVTRSLA